MRRYITLLLLVLAGSSCNKEVTTMEIVIRTNSTRYPVRFSEYVFVKDHGAYVYQHELLPGASNTDTIITGRDAAINDPYRFAYLADSIHVIFDHKDSITHYAPQSETFTGRFYLFSSTRNLMNDGSYYKTATKDKRQFQIFTYTYTFTEQDHEDAKK